jgi:hypothetical protein
MDPFSGTLHRAGFLLWSVVLIAWVISFGLIIDSTKAHHIGAYWLPERIIWAMIFLYFFVLVSLRRIQNAGLSNWSVILALLPYAGFIFWFVLFFIPTKVKNQQSSAQI